MVSYDDSGFTGPTMGQLFTRVCPGYWDGTDDNIRLEFRNRYPSEPRETCMTDYLDKAGAEFVSGHEDKWLGKKLLSCYGQRFRPIYGLEFRFHSNTWGWNLHVDQVELCAITARFGSPGDAGYSVWQWNGNTTNEKYGWFNSHSNWNVMTQIAG